MYIYIIYYIYVFTLIQTYVGISVNTYIYIFTHLYPHIYDYMLGMLFYILATSKVIPGRLYVGDIYSYK